MNCNVGGASRPPPSAEPTERPRLRGRVSWTGETPALRWRPRGFRDAGAQQGRGVLSSLLTRSLRGEDGGVDAARRARVL